MYKVLFICLLGIFWTISIFVTIISGIKVNIVQLPISITKKVSIFLPQGWGFFTKSPKEAEASIYKINTNNTLTLISINNASYLNHFGLSRKARKIGFEISQILKEIPDSSWQVGNGDPLKTIPKLNYTLDSVALLENINAGHYYLFQ